MPPKAIRPPSMDRNPSSHLLERIVNHGDPAEVGLIWACLKKETIGRIELNGDIKLIWSC